MSKTEYDFSKSKETRECRHCGKQHPVGYATFSNNTHHLVMVCEERGVNVYIPIEPGLDIPSVLSKKARNHNQNIKDLKQQPLFEYLTGRQKKTILPTKISPY